MDNRYVTVNIEEGMPYADQAVKRLTFYIKTKKEAGYKAMKVIHGFGSSGTGGKIRIRSREYLESLCRRGEIKAFVKGEEFSIFNAETRKIIDACPEVGQDRDLQRHNNGVTIILL